MEGRGADLEYEGSERTWAVEGSIKKEDVMEDMVTVRFKKQHRLFIKGRGEITFKESEIVELEKNEALRLFKAGVVLPGPSEGGVVENRFEV